MTTLHVLEHVEREGPERIATVAGRLGFEVVEHRLYRGEPVPDELGSEGLLVVMGGPMSAAEMGDPRWPWMAAEVALITASLAEEKPVFGICLGAQLIARAAGARVYPLRVGDPPVPHRELGWGPVRFVRQQREEPVLAGLHGAETVLHWHGDTFDLPPGAVLLASTLPCPNQMFRLGARAFGLQFHIEVTRQLVERWVSEDAEYVGQALGPKGVERILADTEQCIRPHERMGDLLIGNLLRVMTA